MTLETLSTRFSTNGKSFTVEFVKEIEEAAALEGDLPPRHTRPLKKPIPQEVKAENWDFAKILEQTFGAEDQAKDLA